MELDLRARLGTGFLNVERKESFLRSLVFRAQTFVDVEDKRAMLDAAFAFIERETGTERVL